MVPRACAGCHGAGGRPCSAALPSSKSKCMRWHSELCCKMLGTAPACKTLSGSKTGVACCASCCSFREVVRSLLPGLVPLATALAASPWLGSCQCNTFPELLSTELLYSHGGPGRTPACPDHQLPCFPPVHRHETVLLVHQLLCRHVVVPGPPDQCSCCCCPLLKCGRHPCAGAPARPIATMNT